MNGKPARRVPLDDLLAALKAADVDTKGNLPISLATGLSTRTIIRARRLGGLSLSSADRACTRALGAHPLAVWGDQWDHPNEPNQESS